MTTTCNSLLRALCSRVFLSVFMLLVWWNFALFYHASDFQPLLAIGADLHTSSWYDTHFAKCHASQKFRAVMMLQLNDSWAKPEECIGYQQQPQARGALARITCVRWRILSLTYISTWRWVLRGTHDASSRVYCTLPSCSSLQKQSWAMIMATSNTPGLSVF